ncbi:MAG: hypothetical protein AABW49_00565 [Nanoarchaeota archaeon]
MGIINFAGSIGLALLLFLQKPEADKIKPTCAERFNYIIELQSGMACINALELTEEKRFYLADDQLRLACTTYKLDKCDDELSEVYQELEKRLRLDSFDPCTYIPNLEGNTAECYFDEQEQTLRFVPPFSISVIK